MFFKSKRFNFVPISNFLSNPILISLIWDLHNVNFVSFFWRQHKIIVKIWNIQTNDKTLRPYPNDRNSAKNGLIFLTMSKNDSLNFCGNTGYLQDTLLNKWIGQFNELHNTHFFQRSENLTLDFIFHFFPTAFWKTNG